MTLDNYKNWLNNNRAQDVSSIFHDAVAIIEGIIKQRDEADRRAGAAERELEACKEDLARFERVRDKMKEEWGVHYNISFDKVWEEALALKRATDANSKHNSQE